MSGTRLAATAQARQVLLAREHRPTTVLRCLASTVSLCSADLNPKLSDRLPDNCNNAFDNFVFTASRANGGTGASVEIEGICQTFNSFVTNYVNINVGRGRGSQRGALCKTGSATGMDGGTGCTLTYDDRTNVNNARRRQTCNRDISPPSNPALVRSRCNPTNALYRTQLWGANSPNLDLTSCDEFPFASSEEGGADHDENGVVVVTDDNIFGARHTCAPTWQQNLQGNCNGRSPGTRPII